MRRLIVLALVSCGSPTTSDRTGDPDPGCSDLDGDGYGVGADCAGPDCNDFVADVHVDEACDEWCASHADSPGCACDSLEPATCYLGAPETLGVGDCVSGLTTCIDGTWSACDGQVIPTDETCNERDDDCDGTVDEDVTNECGTCGECEGSCVGPAEACEDWGDGASPGVVETPEGWLTLDGQSATLHVVWPSSSLRGDIFRVDTRTREIEGDYWTGPNHGTDDSPSRSAVDDFGNVVISNRALGGDQQASITKIASEPLGCPDRDGDGEIETSSGVGDRLAFDDHDAWEDECILWHTVVGHAAGAVARAVFIHPEFALDGLLVERGWVGLFTEEHFEQFDTETGERTGVEIETPGFTPYGAAVDREGIAWVTSQGALYGTFDTADVEAGFDVHAFPGSASRVIVDENDVPWISGSNVFRYDREAETWESVGIPDLPGNIASDGRGSIWSALGRAGSQYVYRITNDEALDFHTIDTPGVQTFGMGVDFDGTAWAFGFYTGNAAAIDVETEEVDIVLDDCPGPCLEGPYVRGDLTGLQRQNALDPMGYWTGIVEGCADGPTDHQAIGIDALTPPGSNLVVQARTAETLAELAAAPWTPVGVVPDDGDLLDLDAAFDAAGIEDAHLLEVKVILQSLDGLSAPTLQEVRTQWECINAPG